MELVIPDGQQVHIAIGNPPLLALPSEAPAAPAAPATPRRGHPYVKGLLALVLLVGAFEAGRRLPPAGESVAPARAALATRDALPSPADQAPVPGRPSSLDLTPPNRPATPAQVPPSFAEQLRQPPTILPPTGRPASGNPGGPAGTPGSAPANAFGLHE